MIDKFVDITDENPQTGGMGHYNEFAFGLIRQMKPKVVLEIGLGEEAISANSIIQALLLNKKNGYDGKYFCIEKYPTKEALKVLETSEKLATLIIGDSQLSGAYRDHLKSQADIVFIDGNHVFQYVLNDGLNVLINNILHIDGILVFHDVWMCSVRQAIKKISDEFNLNILYLKQENMNICLATFKI